MKSYTLKISKKFISKHPKAGELTNFYEKIEKGIKIHTLRSNYDYWEKVINEVNKGKSVLKLEQWSDKPYHSKLETLKVYKGGVGIDKVYQSVDPNYFIIRRDKEIKSISLKTIAKNDGLSVQDFNAWFTLSQIKQAMALIYFTDFRY